VPAQQGGPAASAVKDKHLQTATFTAASPRIAKKAAKEELFRGLIHPATIAAARIVLS
jgi:hypothetical protein